MRLITGLQSGPPKSLYLRYTALIRCKKMKLIKDVIDLHPGC